MMKLLIRADDLGYSQGVNRGIKECIEAGLVKSAGLMPNMETALQGYDMVKDLNACIGQHTNLCLGTPCCDPSLIPSMVDEEGKLLSSRVYRNAQANGEDFVVLEEAIREIDAQYREFRRITGKDPDYFEAHAIASPTVSKALAIVAERNHLPFSDMVPMRKEGFFCNKPIIQCDMESMKKDYDPFETLKKAISNGNEILPNIFVTHPGYVDSFLLSTSSLTYNREKEVKMLCSKEVKQWLNSQNIQLISYNDIR